MLGRRLVDQITDELARLPTRPVTPAASTDAVRQVLGSDRHLPELGTDPQRLLHAVTEQLFEHSLFNGHPRFFGYVTSNPAPIGAFGDHLAAIVNANVSVWTLSPFATVLEPQTGRWIAALIGDTLALRACIVNFRTSLDDVNAVPGLVGRLGREADAVLRRLDRSVLARLDEPHGTVMITHSWAAAGIPAVRYGSTAKWPYVFSRARSSDGSADSSWPTMPRCSLMRSASCHSTFSSSSSESCTPANTSVSAPWKPVAATCESLRPRTET